MFRKSGVMCQFMKTKWRTLSDSVLYFSLVNAIRMSSSQTVLDVLLGMSDVSISRYSFYERSFSVSLSHGIRISLGEISGRGPVRRRGIRLSEAERGESVSQ